jgi:hypothetical protein
MTQSGLRSFSPDELRESSTAVLVWLAGTGCTGVAIHFDVDTIDSNSRRKVAPFQDCQRDARFRAACKGTTCRGAVKPTIRGCQSALAGAPNKLDGADPVRLSTLGALGGVELHALAFI